VKDTIEALSNILNKERGVSKEKVSKSVYKVSVEFMNKPKDLAARRAFLRRVIEESLDYFPSKTNHVAS
jgi:hypothetical protein